MTFSVGVLYSSQTLLEVIEAGGVHTANFEASFAKIEVADAKTVLETAQKCRWLRVQSSGALTLTERGAELRTKATARDCLREQLYDLIVADPPPWAKKLISGRFEALKIMPDDAKQCFLDCELTEGEDDETVDWWDRTSGNVRAERGKVNYATGRIAEKYSLKLERKRTGQKPVWQALETSVAGFDVLSVVDGASPAKLKIEVKGSKMKKNDASFFVTRNEWNTAKKSRDYCFHLWLVHEVPKLFAVPAKDVEPHIPTNNAGGLWFNAELFYRDFSAFEYKDAAAELGT